MGFVNCDERRFSLGEHLWKPRHAQPLGGYEQKLQFAAEIINTGLTRGGAFTARMNRCDRKTALS
jgi:hypothetical protein